jgi:uncharacterized protein YjbI with pentapeptide repeats
MYIHGGVYLVDVHLTYTDVHLIDVYLTGVHLRGVYLIGLHLMGVYLIGLHLIGVHLMGISWACLFRGHVHQKPAS